MKVAPNKGSKKKPVMLKAMVPWLPNDVIRKWKKIYVTLKSCLF